MHTNFNLNAANINRPFQFFAAIIFCATIALYLYMNFALKITTPSWAPKLLVIYAISFYPILIGTCLFLLIKFRPELQEDSYYSESIKTQLKEAKLIKESLPDDSLITVTDTKNLLESIPEIDKNTINDHFEEAHKWFIANGIYTKQDMNNFGQTKHVIQQLAKLYIDELLRDKKHPLDPIGVSMYGSVLYKSDSNSQVINFIRRTLQNSPEYNIKHP